jgi:hypothetical protein
MEPVVYDFAINERGTVAACVAAAGRPDAAGYYTLQVPPLMRTEGPAAVARAPRRTGALHRRLPLQRNSPAWCNSCSTTCCPRQPGAEGRPGAKLRRCSKSTASTRVQHEQIQVRICVPAASAWRRTACRTTEIMKDVRPGDVVDATIAIVSRSGWMPLPRGASRW